MSGVYKESKVIYTTQDKGGSMARNNPDSDIAPFVNQLSDYSVLLAVKQPEATVDTDPRTYRFVRLNLPEEGSMLHFLAKLPAPMEA